MKATARIVRSKVWTVWEVFFLILCIGAFVFCLHGCANTSDVTSADLERFTNDLAAVSSAVGRVDKAGLSEKQAHALSDVEMALQGGVKVADLMTRIARANGR